MAYPYIIAAGPLTVKTQKSAFTDANRKKKSDFFCFSLLLSVPTFSKYTVMYTKVNAWCWYSQMAVLCIYFYIYLAEKHI